MLSRDFVEVYDRELPSGIEVPGREDVASSRELSESFGAVLHDYLSSGQTAGIEAYVIANVNTHQFSPTLWHTLNAAWARGPEENYESVNSLSFHLMNEQTTRMWYPIFHGSWEGSDRHSAISASQDQLALRGLQLFLNKVKIAGASSDGEYLGEDFSLQKGALEGMLNEFDAGIVLLEFIRRYSSLTVVPAPVQFEHRRQAYNADFIICDDSRAVGVQVKTKVRDEDMAHYDHERIALVDASIDLGNVMAKKTSDRRPTVKSVSWAGLICAHQVSQIKTHGPLPKHLSGVNSQELLRKKMHARQLTAGCRPHLHQAVGKISSRIEAIL